MNATRVERRKTRTDCSHARRGFTLVELMVVIGIIAILVSILGLTLSHMTQQAKEAATNATIKKIHVMLEQRLEAFDRAMNRIEKNGKYDPAYLDAQRVVKVGLRAQRVVRFEDAQVRIIIRKELKQLNFLQTFADSRDKDGNGVYDVLDEIADAIPKKFSFDSSKHDPVTESSELLYYTLTHREFAGASPVDAGEFLASEVADTDGDGLLEFIDAWGNPLRFYRWPTRLFKSNGLTHEANDRSNVALLVQGTDYELVGTDPDDPLEQLTLILSQLQTTTQLVVAGSGTAESFESLYHTPYTYHVPLIVSAGVDGELGLGEPYEKDVRGKKADVVDFGYLAQPDPGLSAADLANFLADNYTNRNQRSGD